MSTNSDFADSTQPSEKFEQPVNSEYKNLCNAESSLKVSYISLKKKIHRFSMSY